MKSLPLKYRPQQLEDLIGQEFIKTTLKNALITERIAPAYLFAGPRGTGKTSTARILAKSLNCLAVEQPTVEPCGECSSCRSIERSNAIDVTEIDAASHNGVENARELIELSHLAPAQVRYKMFLLDECLTGDTQVLTNLGPIRIDDPNIVGKLALSYNESTNNWEYKPITKKWLKGKRETLIIQTRNSKIRCTPEHLIRTEIGWKRAEEIKPGDKILSAKQALAWPKGVKYSNHSDLFVPAVAVKNSSFPHYTKDVLSNMLSTPTGDNSLQNKIITSFAQLKTKLVNWNRNDHFVPAVVETNWKFLSTCLNWGHLSSEYSHIGKNIPISIDMEQKIFSLQTESVSFNLYPQSAWDEYMALCWEMAALVILTVEQEILELPGLTDYLKSLGYNTNATLFPNCNQRLESHSIQDMETNQRLVVQSLIPNFEKFMKWLDPINKVSRLTLIGSNKLLKKFWHGGLWMMALHALLRKLATPQSVCIPKAIVLKNTRFWQTGSILLDILAKSENITENRPRKTTISSHLPENPLKIGSLSCGNIQFPQWHTNLETVKSVTQGIIEPVFDIEVKDNHNFLANELLVHNCHCLTSAAQNTLLKLLEEPPARTIFILCTTELHKVLPTIISRCQLFNFKSLSSTTVVEYLSQIADTEKIDITTEAITAISRSGSGSLRDSLQLLSQLQVLQQPITLDTVIEAVGGISSQELWKLMVNLVKEDVLNLLQTARNLLQTGKSPQLILKDLLNCHRDLLLVKATPENCKSLLASNLEYDQLARLANKISLKRIENNLEQLQKREQQLRFSINNAVWLETCLLNMMDATCIEEATIKKSDRQHKAKTTRVKVNLVNLWSSIVKSTKSSNQKMLSHANLIGLDKESNLAVIAVESKYIAKFQKNTTHLSRIITQSLKQKQPIKVVIEEKQ